MELARIGHPFIDENETRPILFEQLAKHISRTGGLFIIGLDAGKRLLGAQLPGQFGPQRRTTVPWGLVTGLPGEILLPTSTTRRLVGNV